MTEPVIVREFSAAGPCLTPGKPEKKTARFYCYHPWRGGREYGPEVKRVMIHTPDHYSPAHIEPCPSCQDAPNTMYPNGYMD